MLSVDKVRSAFFYVFLLVFVVDPVAFSLQLIGVPKIPFGLIGMAGAVLLVATQAVRAARKKISPNALALGCGYCLLMVMAVFSRYFEWPDVWMWVQNAAYYFVGAYAGSLFSYAPSVFLVSYGSHFRIEFLLAKKLKNSTTFM